MKTKRNVQRTALLLLFFTGCQHTMLQHKTELQTSRLPDLYYAQVLDNIALFSCNASALPFFAYAGAGTTQVQRSAGLNANVNMAGSSTNFIFALLGFTPSASQTSSEAWTTNPSQEPGELLIMRCIYQRILGCTTSENEVLLQRFFPKGYFGWPAMQGGWFNTGRKCDVPACAAYVGHYKDVYVWVMPDYVDYLTKLTLTIIDVATADHSDLGKRMSDPNSNAQKIAKLQDRITFLSGTLKNFNDPNADAFKNMKAELEKSIQELLDLQAKEHTRNQDIRNFMNDSNQTAPSDFFLSPLPDRQRKSPMWQSPPLQPLQTPNIP